MAITLDNFVTIEDGSGTGVSMAVDADGNKRQVISIGSPDGAVAANVIADVKGSAPTSSEIGLIVRLMLETMSQAGFIKLTNGTYTVEVTAQGGLHITEKAAPGTPTWGQATIDATTTNGVQIKAANNSRRRIVVTNHGTTSVYIAGGNISAGTDTEGFLLPGIPGAQVEFFTAAQIRATVTAGTQKVSYFEEVL